MQGVQPIHSKPIAVRYASLHCREVPHSPLCRRNGILHTSLLIVSHIWQIDYGRQCMHSAKAFQRHSMQGGQLSTPHGCRPPSDANALDAALVPGPVLAALLAPHAVLGPAGCRTLPPACARSGLTFVSQNRAWKTTNLILRTNACHLGGRGQHSPAHNFLAQSHVAFFVVRCVKSETCYAAQTALLYATRHMARLLTSHQHHELCIA